MPHPLRDLPAHPARRRALAVVSVLLAGLGSWTSFHQTFATWGVDADTADMVILWDGWRAGGWPFIRTWAHMQDSWLLSLLPLDFGLFALLGTRPVVVLGTGWLIFVGCVGLTVLIAWRVGGRGAALWLLPLLLLANPAALGRTGYLAHPVTHNISLLWGLLAVLAALRWLSGRRPGWLALAALVLLLDAASDPWATAAFVLPLLLASLLLLLLPLPAARGCRGGLAALLLAMLAVLAVLQTRLFGLLAFVPGTELDPTDWAGLNRNFGLVGQVIPLLFNLFPGQLRPYPIPAALTWLLLGGLAVAAVAACLRAVATLGLELLFLIVTGALSCAGVVAAFLIGEFPAGLFVGRFFMNAYVLLPLLLACILARVPVGAGVRRLAAGCAVLMMAAGVATGHAAWQRPVQIEMDRAMTLARFLERNGLHYGYGAYWATDANAVIWLSGGRVLLRAVVFDPRTGRLSPRRGQTSPAWYTPGDRPAGEREVFVVVRQDMENCADMALCRGGVIAQFGPPSRELAFEDARILVWPEPILDRFDRL